MHGETVKFSADNVALYLLAQIKIHVRRTVKSHGILKISKALVKTGYHASANITCNRGIPTMSFV